MRRKSHREVSKALAEDFNLQEVPFLKGSVSPDSAKYNISIEGVKVNYPHHKGTTPRIKLLLRKLRSSVLKGQLLDRFDHYFVLGCLSHLIQDRVVFPGEHKKHEEFERAVAKHHLEDEWRNEEVPLKDVSILDELGDILKMNNPADPKMALREAYRENKLILKSLLQDPDFPPGILKHSYNRYKEHLESRKGLRYSYWLLTYLNPLAPLYAIVDSPAITNTIRYWVADTNKNIVESYTWVNLTNWEKVIFCAFAVLIGLVLNVGLMWILWISIPIIGQIITRYIKIPDDILRNLQWYNFGNRAYSRAYSRAPRCRLHGSTLCRKLCRGPCRGPCRLEHGDPIPITRKR